MSELGKRVIKVSGRYRHSLSSPGKTGDLLWPQRKSSTVFRASCTLFVELPGFALRSLELEQVFVPLVDENKAKKISHVEDVGMQVRMAPVTSKLKVIVIMGGLSPIQPSPDRMDRESA